MSWYPVVFTDTVGVTVNSNSITKSIATSAWDSGASSLMQFDGDGGMRFTASAVGLNLVAGLSQIDTNQNYTSIKYAIYLWTDNNVYIVENGSQVGGIYTSYVPNDIFSIEKISGTIYYKKNGGIFYTSLVTSSTPLLVDTSIFVQGNTINSVEISIPNTLLSLIPPMTSDTTPYGVCTSSPTDLTYFTPAYKAFDADDQSTWLSRWASSPVWLGYQCLLPEIVKAYSLTYKFVYDDRRPNAIHLAASNDGLSWTTLDTQSSITFDSTFEKKVYHISSNITPYLFYRLYIDGHVNNWTSISDFGIYGYDTTNFSTPIVWTAAVNVSTSGNSLTKNAGYNGFWDAGASSEETFIGDGGCSFVAATSNELVCGLSDTEGGADRSSIQYGIYLQGNGNVNIYESGTDLGLVSTYVASDIMSVLRLGTTIYYFKNGDIIYTSLVSCSATTPLLIDVSIENIGVTLTDVNLHCMGDDVYTKLLLHFNAQNNTTDFLNTAFQTPPNTCTASGNAKISTSQYESGASSLSLDGASNSFLSIADSDSFVFGAGDFTIDCWVRFNVVANSGFLKQYVSGPDGLQFYYSPSGNTLNFWSHDASAYTGVFSCPWTPSANQWYHIAFVRSGSTPYFFINGVSQAVTTTYAFSTLPNSAYPILLGNCGTGYEFNGYMDEFRISKVARWTSGFTPSVTLYSYDAYTSLLLHFEGANNSTTFIDDAVLSITPHGSVKNSNGEYKFGITSAYFDGSTSYLTLPPNSFAFGANDFTIDAWVYFNDVSSTQTIINQPQDVNNANLFLEYNTSSGNRLRTLIYSNATLVELLSPWSPSTGQWYHVSLVRSGNTWTHYVNGQSIGTTSASLSIPLLTSPIYIGQLGSSERYFNGYLDEFRISVGIARWTYNFTPATYEYPASAPLLPVSRPNIQDVVFQNAVKATVLTNNLTKTTDAGWDGGASSTLKFMGDGGVLFTAPSGLVDVMCGLSYKDPDQNYSTIDFAWYLAGDGYAYIYEWNSEKGTTPFHFTSYIDGDQFEVVRQSGVIYYLKNGAVLYTSSRTVCGNNFQPLSQATLLVDSSLYYVGNQLLNAKIWSQDGIFYPIINSSNLSGSGGQNSAIDGGQYGYGNSYWLAGQGSTWVYDFGSGNAQIATSIYLCPEVDSNGSGVKDFTLEGSNDNSNWDDLLSGQCPNTTNTAYNFIPFSFVNITTYRYYRFTVANNGWRGDSYRPIVNIALGIPTIPPTPGQFVEGFSIAELWNITTNPYWSDNLFLNQTAFASGSGGGYPPASAVDGNTGTFFSSHDRGVGMPQWLKVDFGFGNAQIINKVGVMPRYDGDYQSPPLDYQIQGSNDNSIWDVLHTVTGDSWSNNGPHYWIFSNTTAYRYYRLYVIRSSGGNTYFQLYELSGYELFYITPTEDISESIYVSESWMIVPTAIIKDISENIILSENWDISTYPKSATNNDIIKIFEIWEISLIGTISLKYITKLNTVFKSVNKFFTSLRTSFFTKISYSTHLNLQVQKDFSYNTNLRCRIEPYTSITIGTLNDFVVKKDGSELLDVDYNTLTITLNLNTTPSRTEFTLARRHDKLDYMLDGTYSQITNNNKIQVYDGIKLLFTGYVSEINADSNTDTIKVVADDHRRQMSQISFELEYGGTWKQDSNHNGIPDDIDPDTSAWNAPDYIKKEINIYTALLTVITNIGGLISGIDNYSFLGSFVPEYTKTYNDCLSFLDQLIRQTANCDWYLDENERIKFVKIGQGQLKTLPLASLNIKRHPYDLIISDVQLNKQPVGYVQSFTVKRGFNISRIWQRQEFSGYINFEPTQLQQLAELSFIDFQVWGYDFTTNRLYVGINQTIYGAVGQNGWILKPIIVVQWLQTSNLFLTRDYLPDIIVGTGLPTKTLYLQSYGKKVANEYWTEELYQTDLFSETTPYLVYKMEERYDWRDYLEDLAGFELSQSNKFQTSASASMLLDAYEYYNLNMQNLINFSNTIQDGIYQNNNGFPLNISGIQIDCSKRIVTLNLTNYGKSYYVKTANYMNNYLPPSTRYIKEKSPIQQWNGM